MGNQTVRFFVISPSNTIIMENFIGQIIMFGGTFDIQGYVSCRGQLMSISNYTALFSLLGTTYGGDGMQTFGLPDLQGRMPIGEGAGAALPDYTLGEKSGLPSVTLLSSNLPIHNHPLTISGQVNVSDVAANSDEPTNSFLTTTGSNFYANQGKPGQNLGGFSVNGTVGITGSNAPVQIMPPYLTISFQICLEGIYPSRN